MVRVCAKRSEFARCKHACEANLRKIVNFVRVPVVVIPWFFALPLIRKVTGYWFCTKFMMYSLWKPNGMAVYMFIMNIQPNIFKTKKVAWTKGSHQNKMVTRIE